MNGTNRGRHRRSPLRRAGRWIGRKIFGIVALALVITLVIVLLPLVRGWLGGFLPGLDYEKMSELLTHEMEAAGELIAVRYTDTGLMSGTVSTFVSVKAPYTYEVGFGLKLADVVLNPIEEGLVVEVPDAQALYDSFNITGDPEISDPFGLVAKDRLMGNGDLYQRLVDDEHAACRLRYENDPEYSRLAWDAAVEQLTQLFKQWSGEDLTLEFVHANGEPAKTLPADAASIPSL